MGCFQGRHLAKIQPLGFIFGAFGEALINTFFCVVHQIKEIHVSTAQRYAAAAFNDGLTGSTIRDIASLASWGKHQQNVERDLHRWMPYAFNSALSAFSTAIEVYNPDTAKIEQLEIPILLASLLDKQNAKLWDVCIGATHQTCETYWNLAKEDWAQNHPVRQYVG